VKKKRGTRQGRGRERLRAKKNIRLKRIKAPPPNPQAKADMKDGFTKTDRTRNERRVRKPARVQKGKGRS